MTTRQHVRAASLGAAVLVIAACGRRAQDASSDTPTLSFTHWTTKAEVFAEHPPLVAGQTVRFAVHLTNLVDFKPLTGGRPSIEFRSLSGQVTTLHGGEPSRPGVFRVDGALPAAGDYTWSLVVDARDVSDRHELGPVKVFPDQASANSATSKSESSQPTIAYLKEQQWTNEFATESARMAELRVSLRAPATVTPIAGGEAVVSAPTAGRLAPGGLPDVGAPVSAGQTLARFEPRLEAVEDRGTLAARVDQARLSVQAAQAERDRAERLLAERAVPARRVEDARRALAGAETDLRAAEQRLEQRDQTLRTGGGAAGGNAFLLRAPIAGRLVSVSATPGSSYEEGAPLFRIVRVDRVRVDVQLPASEASRTSAIDEIAFEAPGQTDLLPLKVVRVINAGVIDPTSHALPLHVEVDNRDRTLLVGQVGNAVLYTRDRHRMVTIPALALVSDAGRSVAFVQVAGESFARRPVEIAARDGNLVGVKTGLNEGDRVVTRGAYEVFLASAAKDLPAEGHVH